MIRLVMEHAGLTLWPILSFALFLISSGAILIWLYRPGSTAFYGKLANLVVDDNTTQNEKGAR